MVRINQTAYKVTTELHYTGGGGIKHFTVSFRVSGQMEWSGATTILAEVVPKSSNLNWTGVIVSSEFAVYSTLEFRVQVTNERGMTTSEAAINELQSELDCIERGSCGVLSLSCLFVYSHMWANSLPHVD